MVRKIKTADDKRFHRTLFGSLQDFDSEHPPYMVYIENGNDIAGFDQLALDYKMAADAIILAEKNSCLSNWLAPKVFIVRQTLELSLKALLEATGEHGNNVEPNVMFSHKLNELWAHSTSWLKQNGYPIANDKRYENATWLIVNFHAIDPSGDLFRFAHSKFLAFKREKTYDRVGLDQMRFIEAFQETYEFLSHWQSVLVMEAIGTEIVDYCPPIDPYRYPQINPNLHPAWRFGQKNSKKAIR